MNKMEELGGAGTVKAAADAEFTASADAGASTTFCCVEAKLRPLIKTYHTAVKDAYEKFYTGLAMVGAASTKLTTLAATTTLETKVEEVITSMSGATKAQGATFAKYVSTYAADFEKFKTAVSGCYTAHTAFLGRAYAWGCDNTYAGKFVAATLAFPIRQAACNDVVTSCGAVWAFLNRVSWMMQTVAAINKKAGGTNTVEFPAAEANVYNAGTITAVVAAADACQAPADAACTTDHKKTVCQAFLNMWGTVPRSSAANFIAGAYDKLARRVLANEKLTGTVAVVADADGMPAVADWTKVVKPDTDVTFPATTAWTNGIPAATTNNTTNNTTSNTSTSTTKNAKVLIGTLLTAILSIALLN
jgi:hypothetical protein